MGRYCFNKLLFGITSAPEHFQKQMSKVLAGLEGALCLIDDILVYAKTQEEHDIRLEAVLKRIQKSGLTLNPEKCEFSKCSLTFLGHVIDKHGVHPDPQKTDAISNMELPKRYEECHKGSHMFIVVLSPTITHCIMNVLMSPLLQSKAGSIRKIFPSTAI